MFNIGTLHSKWCEFNITLWERVVKVLSKIKYLMKKGKIDGKKWIHFWLIKHTIDF